MLILAVLLLLVGVFPTILASSAYKVIASSFTIPEAVFIRQSMLYSLGRLSLTLGIFILLVLAILYIRRMVIGKQPATGNTWACGSTVNSPKIQYTSTSFSAEFASLVKPADKRKQRGKQIAETDYFPQEFKVKNHLLDVFKQRMMPIMYQVGRNLNKLAILQTGKVHHYVLYALLFMLLIFVLSFFELI
jgi:hypothetical protein